MELLVINNNNGEYLHEWYTKPEDSKPNQNPRWTDDFKKALVYSDLDDVEYDIMFLEKNGIESSYVYTFEYYCGACDNFNTDKCPHNGNVNEDTYYNDLNCQEFWD